MKNGPKLVTYPRLNYSVCKVQNQSLSFVLCVFVFNFKLWNKTEPRTQDFLPLVQFVCGILKYCLQHLQLNYPQTTLQPTGPHSDYRSQSSPYLCFHTRMTIIEYAIHQCLETIRISTFSLTICYMQFISGYTPFRSAPKGPKMRWL